MARSRFFAAALVLNVPRFLRLPVFGFFLREYSRYSPDFSFLIMLHRVFADEYNSARWVVGQPLRCQIKISGGGAALPRLGRTIRKPKHKERGENSKIS